MKYKTLPTPSVKCCKCRKKLHKGTPKRIGTLQKHHVLPKTFFKGRGQVVLICDKCHKEIESIYLRAEKPIRGRRNKLPEAEYIQMFIEFIRMDRFKRKKRFK